MLTLLTATIVCRCSPLPFFPQGHVKRQCEHTVCTSEKTIMDTLADLCYRPHILDAVRPGLIL